MIVDTVRSRDKKAVRSGAKSVRRSRELTLRSVVSASTSDARDVPYALSRDDSDSVEQRNDAQREDFGR